MEYNWALNKQKLQRAIAESKSKSDEEVKKIYMRIGGLLDEPVSEVIEESIPEEPVDEIVEEKKAPAKKKRAYKKKNV